MADFDFVRRYSKLGKFLINLHTGNQWADVYTSTGINLTTRVYYVSLPALELYG